MRLFVKTPQANVKVNTDAALERISNNRKTTTSIAADSMDSFRLLREEPKTVAKIVAQDTIQHVAQAVSGPEVDGR
jgi:hypothetical protein